MISPIPSQGKLLRIGHRGAAGHAPENTPASLVEAVKFGVDLVEFDVRRSLDGALVLLHDQTVDRTTNGHGNVETLPFRILRGLDAGGGARIPLLAEALECLDERAGAMIELKVAGIAAGVCAVVQAGHFQRQVIFASFFQEELVTGRSLLVDAQTLALFEGEPIHPTDFVIDARPTHAGLALASVTSGDVQALQGRGIRVFVFTVDKPDDIDRMKRLGVDGIISNFPERM
ncbi:MAG: glycerophosphodiester phosphodiesterase family protein [Nitrospirales bacterium]